MAVAMAVDTLAIVGGGPINQAVWSDFLAGAFQEYERRYVEGGREEGGLWNVKKIELGEWNNDDFHEAIWASILCLRISPEKHNFIFSLSNIMLSKLYQISWVISKKMQKKMIFSYFFWENMY